MAPPPEQTSRGWSIGRSGISGLDAWMQDIERGFDATAAQELRERLGLSRETMARVLGILARTLRRREYAGAAKIRGKCLSTLDWRNELSCYCKLLIAPEIIG